MPIHRSPWRGVITPVDRSGTERHASATITHAQDVGHDLQSSLLVSDRDGQPLAALALRLMSADGSYATYETESIPIRTHLDEVTQCIHQVERQAFDKPNPTAYLGL